MVAALLAAIGVPLRAETCQLPDTQADPGRPPVIDDHAGSDRIDLAHLFFDGSGSMAGFANRRLPPTPQARAYVDLATGLSRTLSIGFRSEIRLHRFGKEILPFPETDIPRLGQENSYLCTRCDIGESRIDKVLHQAAQGRDNEIYVIVTDLFLSERHLIGSGLASLHGHLTAILRGGRSIGLLGIRSGFLGAISDLPSGKNYLLAKERPFYLLVVGSLPAILRFQHHLSIDYLRDLPDDAYHFLIFTTRAVRQPLEGRTWPHGAFQLGEGAQSASLIRMEPNSEELQQLRLDAQFQSPRALIPIADQLTPFSVIPDALGISQSVWMRLEPTSSSACPPWKNLASLGQNNRLLALQSRTGAIELQFALPGALRAFPPKKIYLFRFEVMVTKINLEASAMNWVRDWNFEAAEEAALVAKKPAFFPTLNLLRLTRTMTDIVKDEFQPQPLLRFGLVVRYR